jgi:ubiquinone/menaquinone biosynthesis C-methylase UbiE
MKTLKREIQEFWSRYPCAKNLISYPEGTKAFFQMHDRLIDRLTPYHTDVYQYEQYRGKRVLEVGCGMGAHAWRFARYAQEFYALDLSPGSIKLARKRFSLYELKESNLIVGDAENLPFQNDYFDYVISNGVIHHSPNTQKAIDEIYRVLKEGGKTTIMIYNKNSFFYWFDLMLIGQMKYSLIKLVPHAFIKTFFGQIPSILELKKIINHTSWRRLSSLVLRCCDGHFNPHTKVYTRNEARRLFKKFKQVTIDLYSSRDRLLEKIDFLQRYFGWSLFIQGKK